MKLRPNNLILNGKIEKKNQFKKNPKQNQSQIRLIFETCDLGHETRLLYKRQP
jgi:hypothetical protein